MLGLNMTIEVDEREPMRMLEALDATLTGARLFAFHEEITQEWLRGRARARFAEGGDDAVGGKWERLTESAGDIREHAGYNRDTPNKRTGDLENWITNGANEYTYGGEWATFHMPGRSRSKKLTGALERAQTGAPEGHPMPFGWGKDLGTKPSPSPTPARPVIGMDELDKIHLTTALAFWIGNEVEKVTR